MCLVLCMHVFGVMLIKHRALYLFYRELLEMRSRLYLNLGLVYQTNEDLQSARKFMEKALSIVK